MAYGSEWASHYTLRNVLALVAYYDLKLHEMDVKIVFVNEDFKKEVYIDQLEGFVITRKENLVYKLKKLIYGLK